MDENERKKRELAYQKKWYKKNRKKKYLVHRKWALNNVDKVRDYYLKKQYGLPLEYYNKLLEIQGGLCAICRKKPDYKRNKNLIVDHDHKTGEIRGLLCFRCNVALGLFDDDFVLLFVAHEYLTAKYRSYKD